MYALESSLISQPVVSLQTGQVIAEIDLPVVDLASLEIKAYRCQRARRDELLVVMVGDIRQYASDCIIVDDEDVLTDPADVVRLHEAMELAFNPVGKPVYSDAGRRLGAVEDYNINLESSRIQQLFIRRRLWWAWFSSDLVIDRTQVIDVTPQKITVRDATVAERLLSPDSMPEINP